MIAQAVTAIQAGTFASLFLNFATTPDVTTSIFASNSSSDSKEFKDFEGGGSVLWISTSGLLAIVFAFPFASWGLDNHNYITCAGVGVAALRISPFLLLTTHSGSSLAAHPS